MYASVCLHSVCGGHAVHVLRPYIRPSRDRMPVLQPLPLGQPMSLVVSTAISSNLHAPFSINLLYWLTSCHAMTCMYLLCLSHGMIKMMILQCVWYDLLATKVLMLHNLAVLLYCGNSMVVVLSFRTRTAFLPTDCHSASPWLFLR